MSYANDNHWQWVERNTKKPMSDIGKAVANVLGYVGRGIYNAPINVQRVDWSDDRYICVIWNGSMANWDFPTLSLLWIECHRNMLRVEISAGAPRRLKLEFWQRKSREGDTSARLPDCEEMIVMVDQNFGRIKP